MIDLTPSEALAMIGIAAKGLKKKKKSKCCRNKDSIGRYYLDEKGNIRRRKKNDNH